MKKTKLPDLKLCIILDLIGCLSYVVPLLGEFTDIVWAPVSGIIFFFLFGRKFGLLGGTFSFIEEIIPGLDFIPTFTIGWFMRKREMENENKQALTVIEQ